MLLHKIGKSKSPLIKSSIEEQREEKERKSHQNTLPSGEYKPLLPPVRLQTNTYISIYTEEEIKDHVEISVKRFGDDDENAPRIYMQMYRESERYTGFLKGKSISFPIKEIGNVKAALDFLSKEIQERGIK